MGSGMSLCTNEMKCKRLVRTRLLYNSYQIKVMPQESLLDNELPFPLLMNIVSGHQQWGEPQAF